jgi:hypothetical protein
MPTISRLRIAVALAFVAGAGTASLAGQELASAGRSTLKGVVFDSLLSRRPLAGAEIWVVGTTLSTRTDERGRFQLDDVPGTRQRIVAYHPLLDSLGLSAPSRLVDLSGLSSAYLTLATPDAATLYARQCPGPRPRASGVLLGTLETPDSGAPVSAAVVEAQWVEWSIGRRTGNGERVLRAATDAQGRFRLCGVPNDVALAVVARYGEALAGPVEVHLRQQAVAVQQLTLAGTGSAPLRGASVLGRLLTESGRAVAGAEVRLLGEPRSVFTDREGRFVLPDQPAGSRTLEIRAIGYAPRRVPLTLRPGGSEVVELQVEQVAVALPELSVTGKPTLVDLSGFAIRRLGGRGIFLDEEEIRKRRVNTTADLFKGIPGVEVIVTGENGVVLFRRAEGQIGKYNSGSCYPQYYVDGVPRVVGREDPVTGGLIPVGQVITDRQGIFNADIGPGQLVRKEDLAGIEIYKGTADVPPQFAKLDAGCGVIVLWTRRGKPTRWFRDQDDPPELRPDPLPERRPQ